MKFNAFVASHLDLELQQRSIGKDAVGAIPCGTRVRKVGTTKGDTHPDGALAKVLGSIGADGLIGYWVEWDDLPGIPVFIAGPRIAKLESARNSGRSA